MEQKVFLSESDSMDLNRREGETEHEDIYQR